MIRDLDTPLLRKLEERLAECQWNATYVKAASVSTRETDAVDEITKRRLAS